MSRYLTSKLEAWKKVGVGLLALSSACAEVAADESKSGDLNPTLREEAAVTALAESGLPSCKSGSKEPCGTFVTNTGTEIPLGKYGVVMDRNVGTGFENRVSPSDTEAGCRTFTRLFGGEASDSDTLLALGDLKLALYTVYRPAQWVEGEKYPVITWGNGTCAQPEGYSALLRYVASQGFVVIAPNSRYVGSGNEQRKAVDFAVAANKDPNSPYYGRLDTARVGAMGHSQGSGGTVAAAADPRISAVVLFNGGTSARKPFLAISGDRDIGNPTVATYRNGVNGAPKGAFLFFHKVPTRGNADGHLTLMTQPERVTGPTAAWFKYVLAGDASYRSWFLGTDCELCGKSADFDFGQKGL
jgi:hypothetical protein